MRVLNSVTDPRMGGPQRRALAVAEKLRQEGIETVFLVPRGSDKFVNRLSETDFSVRRIHQPRPRSLRRLGENLQFLGTFPWTVRDVAQIIKEENIDVVHANMSANFQVAKATTQSDARLVWHINATVLPRPVNRLVTMLARRWADEIVVSSQVVNDHYHFCEKETETIYPPVDIDKFDQSAVSSDRTALREELGINPEIPIIGTVGNLNPVKGYKYLLNALTTVQSRGGEVAVPIVGAMLDSQQSYARRLRTLRSKLGLENTVKFVGWRSDVPELMNLFDLFVLPSISESGPMVVLEAMAMNCPVVMTEVGLIPEQFKHKNHGWIVPPKDPDALATALVEALSSPEETARRARRARERVVERLTVTASAERHLSVYQSAQNRTQSGQ